MIRYRCVPVADILDCGDEAIALLDTQCVRINLVAAAILAATERSRSVEELCELLEAQFGPAPEGTLAAVERQVRLLTEFGVLRQIEVEP